MQELRACECGCGISIPVRDCQRRIRRYCRGHRNRTHGKSKTADYNAWGQMIQRCTNPNNERFLDYGGRGITVCPQWRSFEQFMVDMGPRPARMTIDRINNDGNYEPGNCRWATRYEQNLNTRQNVWIEFSGERKSLSQWAKATGIDRRVIRNRIRKYGWSVERALTERPVVGGLHGRNISNG